MSATDLVNGNHSDYDEILSSSSSDSEGEDVVDPVADIAGITELSLIDDDNTLMLQVHAEDVEESYNRVHPEFYEDEGEADEEIVVAVPQVLLQPEKTDIDLDADKKKKKRKKKKTLFINLSSCKYEIVRKMSKKFGFKEVSDDEDWTLYWTDYSVALERVMDMKRYQKINHFPGMSELCRKDLLARNLNRMQKLFPKEYNIFPKSWHLPADYGDFQAYVRQKKNKTYILKPESGCQGKGIWVTKNPKEIKPHEHMICQQYIAKPLLIDNFKFDLRIYVVLTSCDPLRIFVFKDGLARFATVKYVEPTYANTENVFMHLTNYAINKHSSDFVRDEDSGSKRRITTVDRYMRETGYDVDKMWADIDDVIIKTLISAHAVLKHNYRTCFPNHVKGSACFEILGFDVLLDKKLRPYVIEVNHSPSFNTDSELDRDIKGTLVWDTLNVVNFGACERKKCLEEDRKRIKERLFQRQNKRETKEELEQLQAQYQQTLEKYEGSHMGNLRLIYPGPGTEKYDKLFNSSGSLFQETAAFKARSEMARQQREEIQRKKDKLDAMLKGKKAKDGLRPESPGGHRKKARRPLLPTRKMQPSRHNLRELSGDPRQNRDAPIDTSKPLDIMEDEELERISGLLQRDNLVRGLGIVEHVYRLLHCTPGTTGILKAEPRGLPPNHLCSDKHPSKGDVHLGCQVPIRVKDRNYYKKLLDRYFGNNHALANENMLKISQPEKPKHFQAHFGNVSNNRDDINRKFPHVRLCYSSSDSGYVLTHDYLMDPVEKEESEESKGIYNFENEDLLHSRSQLAIHDNSHFMPTLNTHHYTPTNHPSHLQHQLGSVSQTRISSLNQPFIPMSAQPSIMPRWTGTRSGSLGYISDRPLPTYQRNKYARKMLSSNRNGASSTLLPETEYRNYSHLLDTEAERNRLLARNGYSEWRTDATSPNQKRVISAQRRDIGHELPKFLPTRGSHGLSVVSGPAPVVQRPDLVSPGGSMNRLAAKTPPQGSASHKSTKSQRIRGASNNLRLKQLELRENHATVLS